MPQFLILAMDGTDEDALKRRLAARVAHLQRMREAKSSGIFITGGAKLDEAGKMIGSMLVVNLSNEEEATAWLQQDPYVTGGVWKHIEIFPFQVADV